MGIQQQPPTWPEQQLTELEAKETRCQRGAIDYVLINNASDRVFPCLWLVRPISHYIRFSIGLVQVTSLWLPASLLEPNESNQARHLNLSSCKGGDHLLPIWCIWQSWEKVIWTNGCHKRAFLPFLPKYVSEWLLQRVWFCNSQSIWGYSRVGWWR